MEGLHNVAALCKVTIPKLSGDPENKAKQFSFCGYCGVWIENFETDVNHIRHHLRPELLCGGCYGKAFIMNIQMSSHLKKCEAILNVLGQLGDNKQGAPRAGRDSSSSGDPYYTEAHPWLHTFVHYYAFNSPYQGSSFYSERLCPSHPNYRVRAS